MKDLVKKPAFWLFVAAIAVVAVVMYNKQKEEKTNQSTDTTKK